MICCDVIGSAIDPQLIATPDAQHLIARSDLRQIPIDHQRLDRRARPSTTCR